MIRNEEQQMLVREKFKVCESYFNALEQMISSDESGIMPEQINIPQLAMLVGKLMVNFADLSCYLEIYGTVEEQYRLEQLRKEQENAGNQ